MASITSVSISVKEKKMTDEGPHSVAAKEPGYTFDKTKEAPKSNDCTVESLKTPIHVYNPTHSGCGHSHFAVSEGVPKPKETLHTYVEGHFVVETKYGFTVPADVETLAAATVIWNGSHEKASSNT